MKYEAALAIKMELGSTPGFVINGAKQMTGTIPVCTRWATPATASSTSAAQTP